MKTSVFRNHMISILLVLIATFASSALYANQASRIKDLSDSVLNIFGRNPPYWKVIQSDENPSVDVGDCHGYRVVFEHAIMEPAVPGQRADKNRKEGLIIKVG